MVYFWMARMSLTNHARESSRRQCWLGAISLMRVRKVNDSINKAIDAGFRKVDIDREKLAVAERKKNDDQTWFDQFVVNTLTPHFNSWARIAQERLGATFTVKGDHDGNVHRMIGVSTRDIPSSNPNDDGSQMITHFTVAMKRHGTEYEVSTRLAGFSDGPFLLPLRGPFATVEEHFNKWVTAVAENWRRRH